MPLLVLAAGQAGLASARQCDADGFDKCRRHRLVSSARASYPTRGVLDLAPVLRSAGMLGSDGPDHRRRRAACLALLAYGRAAIAVGPCALVMLGVRGLPRDVRPEVAVLGGSSRPGRDGIVVRRFAGPIPTVRRGAFAVATPVCALAQAVRELDRDHAVAVIDSALSLGLVHERQLDDVARLMRGRRGARRSSAWLVLADGRSQSPLETRARLQCLDVGIPPDELQVPICDARGRVVARGDLGWRLRHGRWLIAEIDGAGPHSEPEALYVDRSRQNAIVATGRAILLRFTAADVAGGRVGVAVTAHLALESLRELDGSAT
jgi:hypothetical protein